MQPTTPCPPPPPLAVLREQAAARLARAAAAPILSPSFTAPCERCGRPRLTTTGALCPVCEVGGLP